MKQRFFLTNFFYKNFDTENNIKAVAGIFEVATVIQLRMEDWKDDLSK